MKCKQDVTKDIVDSVREMLPLSIMNDEMVAKMEDLATINEAVTNINAAFRSEEHGPVVSTVAYDDAIKVEVHPPSSLIDAYYSSYLRNVATNKENLEMKQYYPAMSLLSTKDGEDYFLPDETEETLNDVPAVGVYSNIKTYKENLLATQRDKLSRVRGQKRTEEDTTRLRELTEIEHRINLRINGSEERGIEGLVDEVATLRNNPTELAVRDYMIADLRTLDNLSKNPSLDNLGEAKKIINFLKAAGGFILDPETGMWKGDEDNPFFDNGDHYFEDAIKPFKNWAEAAKGYEEIFGEMEKDLLTQEVNNNPKVRQLIGEPLTYAQIVNKENGLKDTHWVDMMLMDVTNGIFGGNGWLPQVMLDEYEKVYEEKSAYARKVEHLINSLIPKVEKILGEKGYSLASKGIVRIAGVSYDLFRQKNSQGQFTGNMVSRYSDRFYRSREAMSKAYSNAISAAKLEENPVEKRRKMATALAERKDWYLRNVTMMEIGKLPEVVNDADLQQFSHHFDIAGSEAYKQELIKTIGQKAYDEEVAKQVEQIKRYTTDEQIFIDSYVRDQGKADFSELDQRDKDIIQEWVVKNNPFYGVDDYFNVDGIRTGTGLRVYNWMNYNVTIPNKLKMDISEDSATGRYNHHELNEDTGYWDGQYKDIEDEPDLLEFHKALADVFKTVKEYMPERLYNQTTVNSIPALQKTIIEILSDKNIPILRRLVIALKEFFTRFRQGFGIVKEGDMSFANRDTITGKPNYEVNSSFLSSNSSRIASQSLVEKAEFVSLFNSLSTTKITGANNLIKIVDIANNQPAIIRLSKYLNCAPSIEAINQRTGEADSVSLDGIIKAYVTHQIVQEQSFDLPKIAKYFANLTMEYAARQQVLPALQVMKEHYEGIKAPLLNKQGEGMSSYFTGQKQMDGMRGNAIRQMGDYFDRVILGNNDKKHFGIAQGDTDYEATPEGTKARAKELAKMLTGQNVNKKFYVGEEKRMLDKINQMMGDGSIDDETKSKLAIERDKLGRTFSASAAIDNFLNYTRLKGLGYNLSAAITNFLEGTTSNMILASSGEYFKPELIYPAYAKVRNNFLLSTGTLGFKKTSEGKKIIALMERYRVLQDSSNELQKSSIRTNFSWTRNLSPYELNRRTEFVNQSPLMVAMLMDRQIVGKDGVSSSIFDAMDDEGNLLPNFATEEHKADWEDLRGESYKDFKGSLKKAIGKGHGNYDDKRGMMIKKYSLGKAVMMFKTWIPNAIYSRFAAPQDDLASGLKDFKGRYRSFTPGSGGVFGGLAALTMLGPLGIPVGLIAGAGIAKLVGSQSQVGFLMDMMYTGKALFKKALGIPVNLIAGREVIKDREDFQKYVGQKFTEQDAKNLKGNIADMAMLLGWITLTLMAKAAFWDDDDDKDSPRRRAHNLFVNRFTQMTEQAEGFINPRSMWNNTIGDMAMLKWYDDVKKLCVDFDKAAHGDDTIVGGMNSGQSELWNQTKRTFAPGMFKDGNPAMSLVHGHIPTLGFQGQMQSQSPAARVSVLNRYFQGPEKTAKRDVSEIKAKHKIDLEDDGLNEDQLKQEMKRDVGRTKKHNESYQEYEKYLESREEGW